MNSRSNWIFILLLFILSLIYSYPGIVQLRPRGVHQWRQTDCLSITTNFYERGMNFTEPEIHCLISDDLTSGKTIGECPITYYAVAILWKVFGKHEWIYRLFTMLLFLTGIYYFFRTLKLIRPDYFWNTLLGISLFTAPLLVYYGSGFLSDIHALSIVLISFFYFLRYGIQKKKSDLIIATILIVIAGLLKITALILFLTIGGLFFLELVGIKLWPGYKVFSHRFLMFTMLVSGILVVASWYLYAEKFNSVHGGKYTFNDVWPIWKASSERVREIGERFRSILIYQVFSKPWMYALLLMMILLLLNIKKIPRLISCGLIIMTIGCGLYGALWFEAFDVHDYYLTNLYILPAAITAGFYYLVGSAWPSFIHSKQVKVVLTILTLWGIGYTASNINLRFYPKEDRLYLFTGSQAEVDFYQYNKWAYDQETKQLETIEPYLEEIGVLKDDLVITQPDPSFNINLYLMNRRGWSSMGDEANTENGIWRRIQRGAKYLIITNDRVGEESTHLNKFLNHPRGTYHNVKIFDLRPYANLDSIPPSI